MALQGARSQAADKCACLPIDVELEWAEPLTCCLTYIPVRLSWVPKSEQRLEKCLLNWNFTEVTVFTGSQSSRPIEKWDTNLTKLSHLGASGQGREKETL